MGGVWHGRERATIKFEALQGLNSPTGASCPAGAGEWDVARCASESGWRVANPQTHKDRVKKTAGALDEKVRL